MPSRCVTYECIILVAMVARYLLHAVFSFMVFHFFPKQKTGITPLSVACIVGDLPIVQHLLQAMRLRLPRCQPVENRQRAVSL